MQFSAWVGRTGLLAIAAMVGIAAVDRSEPEFDLVIRNGKVIDGSGNPSFFADIAVNGGVIVEVGRNLGTGKSEVDAKGQVVAPGFIDVHTHAENVVDIPNAENFLRMGVTSIVIGNCGGSEANLKNLFDGLQQKPVSVNVASLFGHNTARRAAMGGNFNRPPSTEELRKMKDMVDLAMQHGAVGLSTGLIYLPGTYSKTDEIVELAKVSSRYGGLYASHMRSEGTNIVSAINELLQIAREADCRAQLSHIKLSGENMWGKATQILEMLEAARREGIEVTQDQYAYTASSTSISTLINDRYLEGGAEAFRERLADPKIKAEMVAEMKDRLAKRGRSDYAYAVIASYRRDPKLNGKNLMEAAKLVRGSDTLDDQIELILQIQANGGASGVFHGMSEDDLRTFMRHPNTMIASDSATRQMNEDVPHPRGYGNNARVLGRYVREYGVIRLEDAVRRMTSLPAQTFRFRNRGLIREGMAADIVIFDPATVIDPSTYVQPHQYSTGVHQVFVNGVQVIKDQQHTNARPGRPIFGPGYRKSAPSGESLHVEHVHADSCEH